MTTSYVNQWQDEDCFIIGGGPSAAPICRRWRESIERSGVKVIAVNDAFLLYPKADALYFGDKKWWGWNKQEVIDKYHGPIYTKTARGGERTIHLKSSFDFKDEDNDWSNNPVMLGGRDSGHQAVNLAAHFGVSAIFLIGFDMRQVNKRSNWHDRHRDQPAKALDYELDFLPGYKKVSLECARLGIMVFNLNMNSALRHFPRLDISRLFI